MMKILFCNIAQMKYYKGIYKNVDEPEYGGSYVDETGDAYEKHNFHPVKIDEHEFCFGFVETKSTNKITQNQLHIENIENVLSTDDDVDGVLVIWCARYIHGETQVVGWYKNATVYRKHQEIMINDFQNKPQIYIVKALAKNCVLLPYGTRNMHIWNVFRKKNNPYGFGQANVWFAIEDSANILIENLPNRIENYDGENWLYTFPTI